MGHAAALDEQSFIHQDSALCKTEHKGGFGLTGECHDFASTARGSLRTMNTG